MRLEKCPNNHFYDADKYSSCPHCTNAASNADQTVPLPRAGENDVTVPINPPAAPVKKAVGDSDQKTVAMFQKSFGTQPVVGWLVCVKGKHFGKSFSLKSGRNFVGRSSQMDVALTEEASVSRDKHAIIVFEPRHNLFLAQPGDSKELFYLNGEVVLSPVQLKKNDRLQLGDAVLMLIPCCDEMFNWEKEKNADAE